MIAAAIIIAAALGFAYWRLHASNMDKETLDKAEERLGARDALRFALDNDLPIKGEK